LLNWCRWCFYFLEIKDFYFENLWNLSGLSLLLSKLPVNFNMFCFLWWEAILRDTTNTCKLEKIYNKFISVQDTFLALIKADHCKVGRYFITRTKTKLELWNRRLVGYKISCEMEHFYFWVILVHYMAHYGLFDSFRVLVQPFHLLFSADRNVNGKFSSNIKGKFYFHHIFICGTKRKFSFVYFWWNRDVVGCFL